MRAFRYRTRCKNQKVCQWPTTPCAHSCRNAFCVAVVFRVSFVRCLEHRIGLDRMACYSFPPEIFPRLASRGVIEVERKKNAFFKHWRQKFNATLVCTPCPCFVQPSTLFRFFSQCSWAVWANSGTPWRLRSTMQGLSGSRAATSVQGKQRAHARCKQAVWLGVLACFLAQPP